MFNHTRAGVLFVLTVVVLASGEIYCDCDTPGQCSLASDCSSRPWNHPNCTEDDGYWECTLNTCVERCVVQCVQDSDCNDNAWPDDAQCTESEGQWTCNVDTCEVICEIPECVNASDCEGETWPPLGELDCYEEQGHWECVNSQCVAVCNQECNQDLDCQDYDWEEVCVGHFDCVQGLCDEICDPVGCGNESCDIQNGETAESCPDDCVVPCQTPEDCLGGEGWDEPCVGRWDCDQGTCVSICDYSTCGDTNCDGSIGEGGISCPNDCLQNCQMPTDCTHNKWTKICQGRFTCFMGTCQETCDSNGCGNGTCDDANGETADSCFKDCLGGPCQDVTDCLGYFWYEDECIGDGGHWVCHIPAGACEPICDEDTCGDGICNPLIGESATGCPTDCQEYDCDLTEHCDPLALPDGCSKWVCLNRNCTPICP